MGELDRYLTPLPTNGEPIIRRDISGGVAIASITLPTFVDVRKIGVSMERIEKTRRIFGIGYFEVTTFDLGEAIGPTLSAEQVLVTHLGPSNLSEIIARSRRW